MRFGFGELLLVFIVALLVLGPTKLPAAARSLGAFLRTFKNAMGEATEEIRESVIEPLNEAQKPIRDALAPVEEMKKEIDKEVDSLNSTLRDLTNVNTYTAPRPKKAEQPAPEAAAQEDAPAPADQEPAPAEDTQDDPEQPAPESEQAADAAQ